MPVPDTPLRVVFVYGTLRRGDVRDINRLRPTPRYLGDAWVQGKLYDLGSYPGLTLEERLPGRTPLELPLPQPPESPQHGTASPAVGWVKGELYVVLPALERQLDEIEEVWPQQSGEYAKRDVLAWPVAASGGNAHPNGTDAGVACFLYEVAPERTAGMVQIVGGDWVSHACQSSRRPR